MRRIQTVNLSQNVITSVLLAIVLFTVVVFTISPFTIQPVLSGSNAPAQEIGDVIIIYRNVKPSDLQVGDVIVYSPRNVNYHVIHRIVDIKIMNGDYYFLVKGDFNAQPDVREHDPPYQINTVINFTTTNGMTHEVVGTWYHESLVIGKIIATIPKLFWPFMPLFTSQIPPLLHIYFLVMIGVVLYYRYRLSKLLPYLLRHRQHAFSFHLNGTMSRYKTAFFIMPTIFLFIIMILVSQTITFTDTMTIDTENTNFISLNQYSPQIITYKHRTELKSNEQFIMLNETTVTVTYRRMNETTGMVNIVEVGTKTVFNGEAATLNGNKQPIFRNHTYRIDLRTLLLTSNQSTGPYNFQVFPFLAKFPSLNSNDDLKEIVIMGFIVPVQNKTPNVNGNVNQTLTGKDNLSFIQDMLDQRYSLDALIDATSGLLLELKIELTAILYLPPLALDYLTFTLVPLLLIRYIKKRFEKEVSEKLEVLKEIDELARELRTQKT